MKSFIGTTNRMPVRTSGETGGVEQHRLHVRRRAGHLGRDLCCAKSPVNCLAKGCNCPSPPFVVPSCRRQWRMLHSTLCYLSVQQLTADWLSWGRLSSPSDEQLLIGCRHGPDSIFAAMSHFLLRFLSTLALSVVDKHFFYLMLVVSVHCLCCTSFCLQQSPRVSMTT